MPQVAESLIKENFPAFKDVRIVSEGLEGEDNIAFRTSNGYFFRFAKNDGASRANENEIRLLPALQKSLSVRIPNVEFAAIQPNGYYFFGYKAIEGVSCTSEMISAMGHNERVVLVRSLANFLIGLRAFSVEQAINAGVVVLDQKEFALKILESFNQSATLEFQEPEKKKIVAAFGKYLSNPENFNFKPALVHADLAPAHIFLNANTCSVSGVIDWSDMIVTDPSFEIQDLYQNFGEDFTADVLKAMRADVEQEIGKARFYSIARNLWRYMRRTLAKDDRAAKNLRIVRKELSEL